MGAWIEISGILWLHHLPPRVAPFMGAWIEIVYPISATQFDSVAPFMGAWIEIRVFVIVSVYIKMSRPSWARGLKLTKFTHYLLLHIAVAPFMGAWIEIIESSIMVSLD